MTFSSRVVAGIKAIKRDRSHGASWLALKALRIMKLAIKESQAKDTADFLRELEMLAAELISARPTMVAITNLVSRFLEEVTQGAAGDLDSVKGMALLKAKELLSVSTRIDLELVKRAAEIIRENDILMTCSYSATVCQTFSLAGKQGKRFQVLIAESRTGQGYSYGLKTASELGRKGILTEVIPDEAVEPRMKGTTKVMVGADAVLKDGSLINGVPTLRLALAAKENNTPFYSACATTKFTSDSDFLPVLETGFDIILPYLITGVITEEGILKPEEVLNYFTR